MVGTRNFPGQKHIMQFLKSDEVRMTRLAERGSWESGGRKGLADHAQAEAERLLREHQVEPLGDSQIKELDAIMASAEKDLVR